ncbi:MAG: MarR family winged helix-turn-helix transcriptional regulator [Acidobacteriota bacterium]
MAQVALHDTGTQQRLAKAVVLVYRYSLRITALVDDVVGAGSSGNAEVQVLTALIETPALRPRDIMELTGLSRAGVAALVSRLEEIGLVERRHGKRDRRTVLTSLTRAGRRRLAELDTALEWHYVESRPLAEEIVTLLCGDQASSAKRDVSETALMAAGRLGAAGAPYDSQLADEVGLVNAKSRIALAALLADGPLRPGELADVLDLTSGGLTYLVNQLEADGLVERSYGLLVEDRRAVVISLTERGAEIAGTIASILDAHSAGICDAFSRTLQPSSPD